MNKKNLIYLGVLAVLILVYFVSKGLMNYTEKYEDFFKADSTSITSIELSSPEGSLKLALENGEWVLTEPVNFPAEKQRIERIFDTVLKAKANMNPLTDSKESHRFFGIEDSTAVNLKIYGAGTNLLDDVYVARSSNYNYSLGRYSGQDEVYQLDKQIFSQLSPKADSWRKRAILEIEKENIESINVKYSRNQYSLSASDTLWVYKDAENEFGVAKTNSQIQKVFGGVLFASTSQFVDNDFDTFAEKFKDPAVIVDINLKSGEKINLKAVNLKDENNRFIVMKNDEKEHLYYLPRTWSERFTKSAPHFKE